MVAVPVVDQDRPCIHVSLASGSGQGQLTDVANQGGICTWSRHGSRSGRFRDFGEDSTDLDGQPRVAACEQIHEVQRQVGDRPNFPSLGSCETKEQKQSEKGKINSRRRP